MMDVFWIFSVVGIVMARHDENVESIVIPKMEKEIVVEHGNCAWMALCAAPAPPSSNATIVVMFAAVGGCALPTSVFSPVASGQSIAECPR